jgi:hypothetical protein
MESGEVLQKRRIHEWNSASAIFGQSKPESDSEFSHRIKTMESPNKAFNKEMARDPSFSGTPM